MDSPQHTFDGPLVGDRYQLGPLLGRGGQGSTHLALDRTTGAHVAVKEFDLSKASGWKDLELFRREGEALKALDHPGIPRHMAEVEGEDGRAYLVMEYVPGRSLKARLEQEGRFPEAALVEVLGRGLEILTYLESRAAPVVHRDIKPSNLIEGPDGTLSLVDFGGVKLRARTDGGSTVVGTMGYMAPEQLYGQASPATDLYGLGATLMALATAEDPEELPRKGLRIDVDRAAPHLSAELRQVIGRLTAPDPAERPTSARALLDELRRGPEPALEGEVISAEDWRGRMPSWGRRHWEARSRPRPFRVLPFIFLVMIFGWVVPGGLGFFGLLGVVLPIMLVIWFFTTVGRVRRMVRESRRQMEEQEERDRREAASPWMTQRRREQPRRQLRLPEPPEVHVPRHYEHSHGRQR